MMVDLQGNKLVEGQRRSVGNTKLWRLTKKGRELMGVKWKPRPFNTPTIDHILGIGNILFELSQIGNVFDFTFELREPFVSLGREWKFSSDAFFGFNGRAYLLEYQISPLTSERWAEKWKTYNQYLGTSAFHQAFWNEHVKGSIILPRIIVVTNQQIETVKSGCKFPLIIVRDIKELFKVA
ncbi:MAG TPA: hypothetical protein VJ824_13510 [Bacillota bacterium]|nr:hypothetical protein [Bacillota bacterium]